MQIIYTCPKYGADMQEVMLDTTPIHRKQCISCGWPYTDTDREDILRISFEPPTEYKAERE